MNYTWHMEIYTYGYTSTILDIIIWNFTTFRKILNHHEKSGT